MKTFTATAEEVRRAELFISEHRRRGLYLRCKSHMAYQFVDVGGGIVMVIAVCACGATSNVTDRDNKDR